MPRRYLSVMMAMWSLGAIPLILSAPVETVPLHQAIIRDEAFQRGDYTIKWLEQWLE